MDSGMVARQAVIPDEGTADRIGHRLGLPLSGLLLRRAGLSLGKAPTFFQGSCCIAGWWSQATSPGNAHLLIGRIFRGIPWGQSGDGRSREGITPQRSMSYEENEERQPKSRRRVND